jgi:poly-gamma-glutamate synthesis protein (capsule biosynthesis protein)
MAEMKFYEKKHPEVMYLGINKSEKAYNTIKYLEKNNIKFALLNYTYGTNGIPLPEDKPWVVNMLDDKDKVKADIAEAKENADVVIVFPHWGTEYFMGVSEYQKEFTKLFSDAGVDIVIGAHPHCIEPVEWVENEETGKKMLVYYSLGNFISSQHDLNTLLGGMAEFTVKKEGDKITIEDPKMAPLVTYYQYQTNFTTYKFSDYTDSIASTHRHAGIATRSAIENLYEQTVDEEFRDED